MRRDAKAWCPACSKCGARHHHLVSCLDALAAAVEAQASFPPGTFDDDAPTPPSTGAEE